jgi:hypothetical protein
VKRILFLLCLLQRTAFAAYYTTTFSGGDENPISEGGRWVNGGAVGLDWVNCEIYQGVTYGLQTNFGYDDSTALLNGTWRSNQLGSAVLTRPSSANVEVEIRLRSTISAHVNKGYEVLFQANGGYVQIVTWHGDLGSFEVLSNKTTVTINNGDTLSASVTNSTISAYVNGALVAQVTNTEHTNGNPGIGFYGGTAVNRQAGWTSFTATDDAGDITAPSVAITSPATGITTNNASVLFGGTASDDVTLTSVGVTNQAGSGFTVTGTTSWSAPVTLTTGSNYVFAVATDWNNNKATNAISLTYAVTVAGTTHNIRDLIIR